MGEKKRGNRTRPVEGRQELAVANVDVAGIYLW